MKEASNEKRETREGGKMLTVMQIKQEIENSDEPSDQVKREGELTPSLPLSLDISNVNVKVNENVTELIKEDSNLINFANSQNTDSFKGPSANIFDPTIGLSPFMSSNVHNLSFNDQQIKG